MSNKRNLKKEINAICSALFAEAVAASLYNGNADEDNVNTLLATVLRMQSDYVLRISHPEPGMPRAKYYRTLIDHFNTDASAVADQICNLNA